MIDRTLGDWLDHISSVHPYEIELGLERIGLVANRLDISRPAPNVVSVAGTNGKGSCVAFMEGVLEHAGYRIGVFSSPHIHHFNERIRIGGAEASDSDICRAFAAIDAARKEVSLSYFEYATIAALYLFQSAELDCVLLEVGLGGRLDAVNLIDADVAIISSISLDHEDWLGSDLEIIGQEKAGIMRAKIPVIIGDHNPPRSLRIRAKELGARAFFINQDFNIDVAADQSNWNWLGSQDVGQIVGKNNLPMPKLALSNVATAMQALHQLPLKLKREDYVYALINTSLAGRFEERRDSRTGKKVVFDVAHNPAAAQLLCQNLLEYRFQNPEIERIAAVIAVMADKDIEAMAIALESCLDIWYIAQVDEVRGLSVGEAYRRISEAVGGCSSRDKLGRNITEHKSVQMAYDSACDTCSEADLVVVTGSFFTVAAVRLLTKELVH